MAITLVSARFYWRLHGSAISDAFSISSLLLQNDQNKKDSERTKKDEEIGPIPSLLAQFV
jgi:hypothetical protein